MNNPVTRTTSVWDALADTPAEAENLRLRSALLSSINDHIAEHWWDAGHAAVQLGLTQPRVTELSAGRLDRFTLDDLVSIGITIGIRLEVTLDRRQH
ncbi:XRE family transcriptional regulator [Corynebacterium sp.]|uniref:helix-turn-helix domain-containing protein n=1 Tax=Corynebacterium sp. TaxID=1720 RepID=UPI0028AABEEA|nr:XRE family transcriptional regulator [Corynebacterium sp.]